LSSAAASIPATARRRPFLAKLLRYQTTSELRECMWGFAFATPWLLGLLIFVLGPILVSLYLSLTKYDIITAPEWLGFGNYTRAFFEDELFWPSLKRTFTYALVVVPVGMMGSLILALMLNRGLAGTNIYRTLYFLPHLTPAVAMAILWGWLLQPSVGPVNHVLSMLGIKGPG